MICAAVESDGGIISESVAVERNRTAITSALEPTERRILKFGAR